MKIVCVCLEAQPWAQVRPLFDRSPARSSVRPLGWLEFMRFLDLQLFHAPGGLRTALCKSSVRKATMRASEMVGGARSTDGILNL